MIRTYSAELEETPLQPKRDFSSTPEEKAIIKAYKEQLGKQPKPKTIYKSFS